MFLVMGNAGFISSTVVTPIMETLPLLCKYSGPHWVDHALKPTPTPGVPNFYGLGFRV